MSELALALRPVAADDMGFVIGTWLRSYFRYWPPRPYFADAGMWRQIVKHEARGDRIVTWGEQVYQRAHGDAMREAAARSIVTVACDRTDGGVLYGFVAVEGATLHYVYVAKTVRGFGVARALLEEARGVRFASHMTSRGAKIARGLKLQYRPERIWPRNQGDEPCESRAGERRSPGP